MIDLAQLAAYYPPLLQGFKRNILREYLQYKLLAHVFKLPLSQKLSFLGGTALRIIHGNTRFSEDIDFDNFGLTPQEFTQMIADIATAFEAEGFIVETREVFKGAMRSYIKFPNLLFDLGLSPDEEEKILVQMDTAPHGYQFEPEIKIINKFEVFSPVRVTPLPLLLSQKFVAAVERKRPKGRDFFDIVFLLGLTKPDYGYLQHRFEIKTAKELKQLILDRTSTFDFEALAGDVAPFLFNRVDNERVLRFRDFFADISL